MIRTMSEESVKIEKLPSDTEDTLLRLFKEGTSDKVLKCKDIFDLYCTFKLKLKTFKMNVKDTLEVTTQRTGHPEGFLRFGSGGCVLPASYAPHADALRRMPLRQDDVWVVTYPRSGTTLTQEVVWLLENNLDYEAAHRIPLHERFTFLEIELFVHEQYGDSGPRDPQPDYQSAESAASPRFFKSHLPLSLLPPALLATSKLLYVARDPRDVAVSFFHLTRRIKLHDYVGDFKSFWNLFIQDAVLYNPFFSHLKEAWAQRHRPNMLFMFYEDIIKDKPAAIRQVSKFFEKEYSNDEIQKLCDHIGIENFKNNESVNPSSLNTPEMVNMDTEGFIRKGGTGGWRKYFDEEMLEQAERWMQRHLRDTDMQFPST